MRRVNEAMYPEGVLADHAIRLRRVRMGMILGKRGRQLAQGMLAVKRQAWSRSPWYHEAAKSEASRLVNLNFGPNDPANISRQRLALIKSIFGIETFYVAEKPGETGVNDTSEIVGMARFRSDVSKNDPWYIKFIKRSADVVRNQAPRKLLASRIGQKVTNLARVYEAIGDIDVATTHQRHHVGAALLHLGLLNAPGERTVTTYVANTNVPLSDSLKALLRMHETGNHERPDLFGNTSEAREVRLEGQTVAATLENLEASFPELASNAGGV